MSADLPPIGTIVSQLAVVAALVFANGFFVAAEFALVSVRRTRIDQLASEGSSNALAVQRALKELDRHIGAAQVGITVVSLLLGAIGERTFHHLFEPLLLMAGLPEKGTTLTAGVLALGLAYLVMTTMHVIIGEQLPKMAAIQKADTASLLIVRPMMAFTWLCTPLVGGLNASVNFFLKKAGLHASEGHAQVHSPEELDMLFTQSHDAGEINKTEFEILHRVVKFSDLTVREIMVPRVEMAALPATLTRGQLQTYLMDKPHTRVPVYSGSLDDIIGIMHLKDVVRLLSESNDENQVVNLSSHVREAPRLPESITIDRLLVEFQHRRQQMAIVIDEFGGTSGLVTMGDLLEQAFGDVHDEFDQPEADIQPLSPGVVRLSGRLRIEAVNEKFGTDFPVEEADTVAGLVMDVLGRVAASGDEVNVDGALLRVEAVERQRIVWVTMHFDVKSEPAQ